LKINVLGTEYTISRFDYNEKPCFEKRGIGGYQDEVMKEIVLCNLRTHPVYADDTDDYCRMAEKLCLRHEIVHAFFSESGLSDSSLQYECGWAKNEEMVDWIALQFPKLLQAFKDADCI